MKSFYVIETIIQENDNIDEFLILNSLYFKDFSSNKMV